MPPIISPLAISPLKRRGGISWSSYWATLISATVENAAPTNVVLTFPTAASTVAADITCTVNGAARVVSSASWTGAVWTVVLASAVVYGDVVVMTFVPSGGTTNITNNVAAEAELTIYITGLATPLSDAQKLKLNTLIRSLKAGLSITNLDDTFDAMWILAGETAESSLRNIVKNAHYATAVNSPTFTQYEGFKGNGANMYINTDFKASSNGINFTQNNASVGVYIRNNIGEDKTDIGSYEGVSSTISINSRNVNFQARINVDSSTYINEAIADSLGLSICTRDGNLNTNMVAYRNKTSLTTKTGASATTARNNLDNYILGLSGLVGYFTNRQVAFAFFGKHITTAMRDVIVDAIETYMDSNGKGVIV